MEEATVEFRSSGGLDERLADARRLEPRSNTSVAFDEQLVLKVYRRLEPGINPELELLNFLTQREFANVPPLVGWYAQTSRYIDATLGVLTRYVPVEVDGWTFALESLAGDPDSFSSLVARLGEVTGAMHLVLASDTSDPAFAPEEPSVESLALLAATLDEGIAEVFAGLPDDEAVAPIAGRGEEVRERLRLLSRMVGTGRVIRHHGDLHLGEVLWTGSDWLILDFEGSRGQPLGERRRKRSPLRDVASVLRSFAYAASVSSLTRGIEPPPGWEERARGEFLGGYFAQVEPSGLLPGGQQATETLLAIFELEKAVDELRYELEHRPDWVPIPVAAIQRLLESPLALTF